MNLSTEQKDALIKDFIDKSNRAFDPSFYIRLRFLLDESNTDEGGPPSMDDVEDLITVLSAVSVPTVYGKCPTLGVSHEGGLNVSFTKGMECDLDLEFTAGDVDINSEEYDEELTLSVPDTIDWLIETAGFEPR